MMLLLCLLKKKCFISLHTAAIRGLIQLHFIQEEDLIQEYFGHKIYCDSIHCIIQKRQSYRVLITILI